jgi:hypothetical protein
MNYLFELEKVYEGAKKPILHHVIEDHTLKSFSQNVRDLAFAMRDWIELSSELDEAIASLRRADWLLRNSPFPKEPMHPGVQELNRGMEALRPFYKNLSSDIRTYCVNILESGENLKRDSRAQIAEAVLSNIKNLQTNELRKIHIIVRQENLVASTIEWLEYSGITGVAVSTAAKYMNEKKNVDSLIVIGLSADYPDSLFTSVFPVNGVHLFSHSWIKEKTEIQGLLSDLADLPLIIPIKADAYQDHSLVPHDSFETYLDPSFEIASRKLQRYAKLTLANIQQESEEEIVECKAYLLANSGLVFLPTEAGSIDSLDLNAHSGDRVQRLAISSITTDSVLLLRVGVSDSDAIINMANQLGGDDARQARELQKRWKSALKERINEQGSAVVFRQLQDRGITNPWLQEWSHPKNIRPNSDTSFKVLLKYLGVEVDETVEAMNLLRYLHQMAGMRFRKILKQKFESIDKNKFYEKGFEIVDVGASAGVAKLGAFRVISIGQEVLQVPENAIKQLQETEETRL